MDEVDGRKGLLFTVPQRTAAPGQPPAGDKLPKGVGRRGTLVAMPNLAGCRFLRVGVKGYGFGFTLKAFAGDREVFSGRISEKTWSDLKIDLGPRPATTPPTPPAAKPAAPAASQPAAEKPETITL